MKVKELIEILDEEYDEDDPIGISVWNPLTKEYNYGEILDIKLVVAVPGFGKHVILEASNHMLQLAYEKYLKTKNEKV